MTGSQIKGKGFRGALRYNLDKVNRQVAEVLDHSFPSLSEAAIMKEIKLVRMLRPNLQKYVYHTSLNFSPRENPSNKIMTQLGHDYLKAMGFTRNQFIMFRHKDAAHPHLHILANRIDFDGKVVSDSNDYQRSENILRALEKKYNLIQVTPSKEVKERAMTKDELEMMKRTNAPSQKMKLQFIIRKLLREKPDLTTQQFIQALGSRGVNVLFNQANTGFVSGISYGFEGFLIKGAKLGNDFKWASIKHVINYEQERDRTIIQEANTRTKQSGNTKNTLPTVREDFRRTNQASEGVRDFDLVSFLDRFTNKSLDLGEDHPDAGHENTVYRKRKRKKRRGRRL
jgi:hypothetical protein